MDTHEGVHAGGAALGAADAAVLITGAAPLGVTVADLVADGQGEATSLGLAANIYYDFALDGAPFDLYAGAGLGLADVEIEYSPSDVVIIDDSQTAAFLQVMLGGAVPISENTDLFGGYRYRAFNDIEVQSVLVPADLDIEYANHILEFGVRVSF